MLRSDQQSVGLDAPAPAPGFQSPSPPKRRGLRIVALVASVLALLVLLALPNVLGLYWMRVLTNAFMFATLAQAINLIAGYTGYPAFGNVVFFGVGAYSTGVTMVRFELPFVVGVATGTILCTLLAIAVGPAMLRLRGHYFAVGTLGLNEATRALVENLTITGGGGGMSLPLYPGGIEASTTFFYLIFLATMLGMLALTWVLMQRPFGYACRAIRADEEAAAGLGVPTTRVKTAAWALSATVMGLCGSIHAYWLSYIDPQAAFSMDIAIKFFLMMLLGGVGTLFGPILGAVFLEFVSTAAWSRLLDFHVGVLGLIMILVVVAMPGGFMDFARRRMQETRQLFDPGRR